MPPAIAQLPSAPRPPHRVRDGSRHRARKIPQEKDCSITLARSTLTIGAQPIRTAASIEPRASPAVHRAHSQIRRGLKRTNERSGTHWHRLRRFSQTAGRQFESASAQRFPSESRGSGKTDPRIPTLIVNAIATLGDGTDLGNHTHVRRQVACSVR